MAGSEPQHRRIRFRRDEIADLDALPSARAPAATLPTRRVGKRRLIARRLAVGVSAAVFAFFALAAALYAVSASGIAQEQMRAAAERAIERVAGRDVAVRIGSARISIDGTHLIGLEVGDVGLKAAGQTGEFAKASSLRFGVELLPLLSGRVVPTSARMSDAILSPQAFGSPAQADYLATLRDARGLLNPDRLPPAVFDAMRRVFTALAREGAASIELENVTLAAPGAGGEHRLVLASAQASSDEWDSLRLAAHGTFDGRGWSLEGNATRGATGAISNIGLRLMADPPAAEADAGTAASVGAIEVELHAAEAAPSRLDLRVQASHLRFKVRTQPPSEPLVADAALTASITEGQGKLEIDRLRLVSGASVFELNGAVGPRPEELGSEALYRYELVGDDLVLAAADSPEPPLHFSGALAGTYDPEMRRLAADRLAALITGGSAAAKATMQFEPGRMPGVDFSLRIKNMQLSEAKQLWPWTAAHGARIWAQQHLRGGMLTEGEMEYHVLPGRIGSGIPAGPDEVHGSFSFAGASFDTVGSLPPVAEASGRIDFRGTDADLALSGGAFRLPSGRALQVGDTKLRFREMTRPPLIAKLDGEVRGDAAAAAELIALEPINAMSKVPFKAEDVSGTVVAHVTADIPLQRDIPRETLDWLVIADFQDLALAQPLDGQRVTGAKGTLSAEPSSCQVEAEAKLNGLPAKLDVVEPLRPDGPQRKRAVEITLDDKARDALAPALSALVKGSVVLAVDAAAPEQKVSADLSAARLALPWIGWSKGAGIPASADFVLRREEGAARVSDLKISGQSFNVEGELSLAGGGLRTARFAKVQLNRGDDLSVDVDRKTGGYAVAVRGKVFDGRALVKASTSAGKPAPEGGRSPDISLRADIDAVVGFGGETLNRLSLSAERSGDTRSLSASATADRGAAVSMKDETKGGKRSLAISSVDAGSVLRFFNIYANMQGGAIQVALSSDGGGPLKGDVSARSFVLVDEPRLASLVSAKPDGGDRSLGEAVKRKIDTGRVTFDRASATVTKGPDYLMVEDGILRGAAIGAAFQGTLYDAQGRMDMTGTFMPAYGLNRLFGELPLIGVILGNGNDRGLLGVTFKLEGNAKSPTVTVNPLSIIAPGIFRRIFEFGN